MSDFSDYEDEEGVDEPDLDAIDKKDDVNIFIGYFSKDTIFAWIRLILY